MDYRPLGQTGLAVSAMGFGCGSMGGLMVRGQPQEQRDAVAAALENGINYFDTAEQYGDGASERNLGRVLRELGVQPIVGTKIRIARDELATAPATLRDRLVSSLGRLGLGSVDVCTLHTRVGSEADELRAEDVLGPVGEALHDLKDSGLTKAVGFTGLGDTNGLLKVATGGAFDTFQCYFNVLNQSAVTAGSPDGVAQDFQGLLTVAAERGLGAFGIRALAGGALAVDREQHPLAGGPGRPMATGEEYDADRERANELSDRLTELGISSPVELALRFALSEPRLSSVLVGFSDREQLDEAVAVAALGPIPEPALSELRNAAA